ncbi:MAG TPA: hypothetical protein VJ932_08095 [Alkalispirochaeta sp.]|nr:hypothetical protein [Alkalispirochaeta sp.]
MNTKETGFLKVLADLSFPEKKIVINPNDGFDLGLMMTDATVEIYYGMSPASWDGRSTEGVYGNIYQKNECTLGSIELSTRAVEKMGSPVRVRLHLLPAGDGTYPQVLVEQE